MVVKESSTAMMVAGPSTSSDASKKKPDVTTQKAEPPTLPDNLSLKAISNIDKIKNVDSFFFLKLSLRCLQQKFKWLKCFQSAQLCEEKKTKVFTSEINEKLLSYVQQQCKIF